MDHLVFGAPDLDAGVRQVEGLLGVPSSPGGRHEGLGTCNRLFGFGGRSYMEVVSPDPDQPDPPRSRWFGLDSLTEPRLVTWCYAVDDLTSVVERALAVGVDLGGLREGSRRTNSGELLQWRMTDPWANRLDGAVPFFIDWGDSPHPASSLPDPCRFLSIRVHHPEAGRVEEVMAALSLDVAVVDADHPSLCAVIRTPSGDVDLC
ncbi:MAG: VOC family protein [Gemmatimonadota bacterium]